SGATHLCIPICVPTQCRAMKLIVAANRATAMVRKNVRFSMESARTSASVNPRAWGALATGPSLLLLVRQSQVRRVVTDGALPDQVRTDRAGQSGRAEVEDQSPVPTQ